MTNASNNGTNVPRPSLLQRIVTISFIVGLSCGVFASGFSKGFEQIPFCTGLLRSSSQQNKPQFSLAEYLRLNKGMPLEAVEAILGRGIEISQTSTTTYIWEQPNSSITVIFENGKLKTKAQTGLR
jgi:hypothetical protein